MEEWRIIKDYPDFKISNTGIVERISDGHRPSYYYLKKVARVDLRTKSYRINASVKKLVATTFEIPNPNNYRNIQHKDKDEKNLCVTNLYYTNKQKHNGGNKGIRGENRKSQAKLNDNKVAFILLNDIKITKLATKFDVSHALIINIKKGKAWKHIFELTKEELEALAKGIELTEEEKSLIKIDTNRNKFTREGVKRIIKAKERDKMKVPLKINSKTTIFVFKEKLSEAKRKYGIK